MVAFAVGTFETCPPILRMSADRGRPELDGAGQNDAIDPNRMCRGHAKIDANERRCDILPLAEGRNSLDWVLTGNRSQRMTRGQQARPDLGAVANEALDPLAAGNRNPPSI